MSSHEFNFTSAGSDRRRACFAATGLAPNNVNLAPNVGVLAGEAPVEALPWLVGVCAVVAAVGPAPLPLPLPLPPSPCDDSGVAGGTDGRACGPVLPDADPSRARFGSTAGAAGERAVDAADGADASAGEAAAVVAVGCEVAPPEPLPSEELPGAWRTSSCDLASDPEPPLAATAVPEL